MTVKDMLTEKRKLFKEQRLSKRCTRVFFVRLGARQQHFAFDIQKLACHDDEFARKLHVHCPRVGDILHVLVADQGNRDVHDVDLVLGNEVEQKVERTFIDLQFVGQPFHAVPHKSGRMPAILENSHSTPRMAAFSGAFSTPR